MDYSVGTIESGMYYDGLDNAERIYSNIDTYGEDLKEVCEAETELFFYVKTGNLVKINTLSEDVDFISKLLPAGLKKNRTDSRKEQKSVSRAGNALRDGGIRCIRTALQ